MHQGPERSEAGPQSIDEIAIAADPARWRAAGFTVDRDGVCRLGSVRGRLLGEGAGRGIVRWSLRGVRALEDGDGDALDGLPSEPSRSLPAEPASHPNGAARIDHVVVFSPDLDRTVAALEQAGLDLRRERNAALPGGGMRQAFFRLDEVVLEVIEQARPDGASLDPSKPARLWGLALLTDDIDATAARLGSVSGAPRAALQPGRRIATVGRDAGLGVAVAFITPPPHADRGRGEAPS